MKPNYALFTESLVQSYVLPHKSELKSMNKLVLIGASLGSLLAFEMASQLGVETEMIVIDGTSNQRPVISLGVMTQCTHSLQTLSISLEEHRSMMIDILNKYKVDDSVLIDHMISHSWQLYLLSRGYHPIRNERISVRQRNDYVHYFLTIRFTYSLVAKRI